MDKNKKIGMFQAHPVSIILLRHKNFPDQGMELNAFYDNRGYESLAWGGRPAATTGDSDAVFNLPQGSYRIGCGSIAYGTSREFIRFRILLTAGKDGKWYIYPDRPMVTS